MCKRTCMLGIAVLSVSLFLPVCLLSQALDATQKPETILLHAQHVFDANVTIAEMLNFAKANMENAG